MNITSINSEGSNANLLEQLIILRIKNIKPRIRNGKFPK